MLSINAIINIVLCIGLALSYLSYRHIKKKQMDDPEYQQRLREKKKEERRQKADNDGLDDYLTQAENQDGYDE